MPLKQHSRISVLYQEKTPADDWQHAPFEVVLNAGGKGLHLFFGKSKKTI